MKKFACCGMLLLVFVLQTFCCSAQYTDSSGYAVAVHDSAAPVIKWNEQRKRFFPYKSYLFPAALVAYGIVSLHTDALQDVNETVKQEIFTEHNPRKTTLDNYLQYSPAVAVYALNLAGVHGVHRFCDRTMIYALSTVITSVAVQSGKRISAETRPDGTSLGFPSGHTATAFAAAEFLRREYTNVSPWYGIGGYAAAVVTGYLRIQNNKHWMGDVVAGAGVGILSTKLAYWVYPAIKRKLFKDKEVTTIVMPMYRDGAFGLGLSHQF